MIAKDIMSRDVVTAIPEMTLHELSELLIDNQITGVPVIGADGILVGVISQTDIVRHERESKPQTHVPGYYIQEHVLPQGFQIETPDYTRVKDCMTPIVISGRENDSVVELAQMMLAQRIHRIVITDKGRLQGIVTTVDLLQALLRLLSQNGRAKKPHRSIPRWTGPIAKAKH